MNQNEEVIEVEGSSPTSIKVLSVPVSLTHALFSTEKGIVAVVDPTGTPLLCP